MFPPPSLPGGGAPGAAPCGAGEGVGATAGERDGGCGCGVVTGTGERDGGWGCGMATGAFDGTGRMACGGAGCGVSDCGTGIPCDGRARLLFAFGFGGGAMALPGTGATGADVAGAPSARPAARDSLPVGDGVPGAPCSDGEIVRGGGTFGAGVPVAVGGDAIDGRVMLPPGGTGTDCDGAPAAEGAFDGDVSDGRVMVPLCGTATDGPGGDGAVREPGPAPGTAPTAGGGVIGRAGRTLAAPDAGAPAGKALALPGAWPGRAAFVG
jgi:hypothetical protein